MKGLAAAVLLAVSLSCNSRLPAPERPQAGQKSVTIILGGSSDPVKSASIGEEDEFRVENWAYWVFNRYGMAVKCGESIGDSASVNLLTGDYTIVVITNYPTSGIWKLPVSTGITKDVLEDRISDLSSNAPGHFLMMGETSVSIIGNTVNPVEVRVARLVAKVGIRKIVLAYDNPRLKAKLTRLKGIYLTNLYRTTRLGSDWKTTELSDDPSVWYNAMGWHRSNAQTQSPEIDLLTADRDLDEILSSSTPYGKQHLFFCYPNPVPKENDPHDPAWSIRCSRMVLETEVDGTAYYYQIPIPAMKRNTPYIADEVIIRDLGSLDPEEEIPGSLEVTFSTEIAGWEGDYVITEES